MEVRQEYYVKHRKLKTSRYSEKEKEFIAENYLVMSDREIGNKLNRNHRGIEGQRFRMGLHKGPGNWIENYNQLRNQIKEVTAVIDYYNSGKGGEVLHQRIVEMDLAQQGVSRKYKNGKNYNLATKAHAYELYVSGSTYKEIAIALSLSPTTVYRWMKLFLPYTGNRPKCIKIKSFF